MLSTDDRRRVRFWRPDTTSVTGMLRVEHEDRTKTRDKPVLAEIAAKHRASPAQIALAWLLARSPVMLPIPGTISVEHLEENWDARRIALSPDEMTAIATAPRLLE